MENNSTPVTKEYTELINPSLGRRLELLQLDKAYYRAKDASLYYLDEEKKAVRVVDFVSGYGAVLLGHNQEQLRQKAIAWFRDERPGFVQLSVKESATKTARWLHREMKAITGMDFITTFANSGTEAIEAAFKHALMGFYNRIHEFTRKFEQEATTLVHFFSRENEKKASEINEQIDQCRVQNTHAIKTHAPVLLAAMNAFHGKTLRAAMTCRNPEYYNSFSPENTVTVFVDGNAGELVQTFQRYHFELQLPGFDGSGTLQFSPVSFNRIAAAVIEPIQGEGGIRPVPVHFLQELEENCHVVDVPLIMDEIQTGCYRTGDLLASAPSGVKADYYVLGKALGGGLAKIAVLLIKRQRYLEQFGLIHSSTFAEDGWSSYIALHALELSKEKGEEIRSKGEKLLQRLNQLKQEFPAVIRDIRGRGLMLGVEFRDFTESNSYCFQLMARSGYLHYLYAAYLLNTWQIRLAAPLSARNVLRIQPAVCITDADTGQLISGLSALCEILRCEDFYKLIEFSLPRCSRGLRSKPACFAQGAVPREKPAIGARKIGFLTHFIDAGTVKEGDPSLELLADEQVAELLEKILPISSPCILGSKNISSQQGKKVHITFAGLPLTSAQCRNALSARKTKPLIELCEKGVKMLQEEEQAELVGLGQYTSIVTNNGLLISESPVPLTTGNSFTVFLGMESIRASLAEKGIDIRDITIGIIGAAGNIATIMAELFSAEAGGVVLVGNATQQGYERAVRTAGNIYRHTAAALLNNRVTRPAGLANWLVQAGVITKMNGSGWSLDDPLLYEKIEQEVGREMYVKVERSLEAIRRCKVVVAATNAARPFLYPDYFSPGTILCDISVPHNCSPELLHNTKSIEVIFGGIAHLPGGEQIPVKGFPLEPGQVFGCMGETILLGLENYRRSFSLGNISCSQVKWIGEIAGKQGITPVTMEHHITEDP